MTRQKKTRGKLHLSLSALYLYLVSSYIFVEFKTRGEAEYALNAMNGHPFDVKHTFRLNFLTDIEKYSRLDETYVEPKLEEYKSSVSDFTRFSATKY
jgi:hypothetical protein